MFQTFTGSSRRPRNVNLSGRNSNPFASVQQTSRTGQNSSPSAVAQAQQERRARQAERDRLQAARTVQRVWKGHNARRRVGQKLRVQWDESKDDMVVDSGSSESDKELQRLKLLVRFADRRDAGDAERVSQFAEWFGRRVNDSTQFEIGEEWHRPLKKLAHWIVIAFNKLPDRTTDNEELPAAVLVALLGHIAGIIPREISTFSADYYAALSRVTVEEWLETESRGALVDALAEPLKEPAAYDGLISKFLTGPDLNQHISLAKLVQCIDLDTLTRAMRRLLSGETHSALLLATTKPRLLWLLAYFIYFQKSSGSSSQQGLSIDFTATISSLLSYLSDVLGQRPDIHNTTAQTQVPSFVQQQVDTLINQEGIQTLLASSSLVAPTNTSGSGSEDATVLASYALTLLRVFPRRGDDIRMWLYMGSMSMQDRGRSEPAIKFFWNAVKHTKIYQEVQDDTKKAIKCLQPSRQSKTDIRQESDWRKVLLFLELYTFVLKVMDDEEFMTGAETSGPGQSWTRQSALTISDVTHLTLFLKHFAFAMYWHSSQLGKPDEPVDSNRIASYFGHASPKARAQEIQSSTNKSEDAGFAGISGMTLDYIKGMVTGLLRMLYERDSRRNFIRNKNHWLMKEFNMKGFISDVVEEQAIKNQQQDEDSDEDLMMDEDSEDDTQTTLIGTSRTQQVRRAERLKRQQVRETKRKQLQNVTPRLEILQNMPFFIPFATRVEIFREFVQSDQYHRRNGLIDADQWRMAQGHMLMARANPQQARQDLSKHSARVRRDHIFDDAYEQFYELGEGLKEPIQITFVDRFDTVEAGIDGGGVTKEFLTSVTSEAFTPDGDSDLFIENDQHLLYPNPSAIDEKKELIKEIGVYSEGSLEWNSELRGLVKRYEFLGRVVGKCLYEGILVDLHFAPFFLVKWALTGGSSAATNESGYRANINDLRDLDEGLYQGLLQLKNYPGNVEDFSLDFTVTDVLSHKEPPKTITRDLRPGGSSIPVTNQNRLIYISSMARHRLQVQPALQTQAFLRGLGSIIQPSWLSMFNQSELQTLLGGDSSEIDVEDLRRNTLYGGVYAIGDDNQEHPSVQMFWDVMHKLSDTERRTVLKYVTSTPRGPLLGFGQLNPRFSIRDSGGDQSRLPSTSTCVNLLKLPIYRDEGVLREKLLYAANAGAGFDLS